MKKFVLLFLVIISFTFINPNTKTIASTDYKTYLISCRDEYTCEPDMGYVEEDEEIGPPIVDYGDGNGPVTPETDPHLKEEQEDNNVEDNQETETDQSEDVEQNEESEPTVEENKEDEAKEDNKNISTTVEVPNTGVNSSVVGNIIGVIFMAIAYFMISYIIKKETKKKED